MGIINFSCAPLKARFHGSFQMLTAWLVPQPRPFFPSTGNSPEYGVGPVPSKKWKLPTKNQSSPISLKEQFFPASYQGNSQRMPGSSAAIADQKTIANQRPQPSVQSKKEKFMPRAPLKMVHRFEGSIELVCAGRMVISGRIADVCAELDRMTQHQ